MDGVRGNDLECWEEAEYRGGGGWSRGLGNFGLILSRVHLPFFGGGTDWGRIGGRGVGLVAFRAGRACGVRSGMVTPAVGTVGGRGRAEVGDRAEVALFGAGGVGASVFRLLVM